MNTPPPETLRNETPTTCAAPGCANPLTHHRSGRPARYCSNTCRVRHHRQRRHVSPDPITVEVDIGSASSRGRPPERAWLVRLRRADRAVIVAIGLRRQRRPPPRRTTHRPPHQHTGGGTEDLTAGESHGRPWGTSLTAPGENPRPPTGRSH